MNDTIAALRKTFLNPPNSVRHLAIIHPMFSKTALKRGDSATGTAGEGKPKDYREFITRRLQKLLDMGFGGIVCNVGHDHYLEDEEQWERFVKGVAAARDLGMRIWIYDEHGYPSGTAGGIVLRDHPEYEAQALVVMTETFEAGRIDMRPPTGWLYAVRAEVRFGDSDEPQDVTSEVGEDGHLRLQTAGACSVTRFDARRAFEGTHATRNVFRIQRYVNVLNEDAVRCFHEVTEGRYWKHLGELSESIEAVFTDEPSFMAAYFPDHPERYRGIAVKDEPDPEFDRLPQIAWDRDLPDKFVRRWAYKLIPELGSLFTGGTTRDMRIRHDFYQLQSEVYADTFFKLQQDLLRKKDIAFSGHVLAEESIVQHVASEGNVLADLKEMEIPGIDMLNSIGEEILDSARLLTCKYGSSAAYLMGREQVMCEASDWEQMNADRSTNVRERMGALAVQMALGVTTITSYYHWKSLSPEDTRSLLDAAARLSAVVRTGRRIARIAVLYPIRTAWACYRPVADVLSPALMDEPLRSMDSHLYRIARSIVSAGLDFDFIDTRDLIRSSAPGSLPYSTLLIPPGAVMCPKDLESVERFVENGGRLAAIEPRSDFALPEASDAAETAGRGVDKVIRTLASRAADRVMRCRMEDDWIGFVRSLVSGGLKIRPNGTHLVARRSVCDGSELVLLANGSRDKASARIEFGEGRVLEIWDPWTGKTDATGSNAADVEVEGYSAVVVVSGRRTDEPDSP